MRPKSRKVACHRARRQRHADKQRARHKAHKSVFVPKSQRIANAMPAKRQPPRGLPKLVRMARERMIGRHKLLTMPREGQKRDAA